MSYKFIIMSDNTTREKQEVAPSMNPDERPDLADYMSKESPSTTTYRKNSDHKCDECGKFFPTLEELTTHYRKDHPRL
jgi:hypothetical protein